MRMRAQQTCPLYNITYMYLTHEYFTYTESDAEIIRCTHAGHDYSKNITEIILRNNVGKITPRFHIILVI